MTIHESESELRWEQVREYLRKPPEPSPVCPAVMVVTERQYDLFKQRFDEIAAENSPYQGKGNDEIV